MQLPQGRVFRVQVRSMKEVVGEGQKPHRRDSEDMVERQHDTRGMPAGALSSMVCASFKPVGIF